MKNITRYLVFGILTVVMVWLSLGATGCSSDSSSSTEPVVEQPEPDHGSVDPAPGKNPSEQDGSNPGSDG